MKKINILLIFLSLNLISVRNIKAQYLIYDDKMYLEVYSQAFLSEEKDNLITMIKDKKEDPYKRAAAVSVLRERFFTNLTDKEKLEMQDTLRKVFRRGGSSFLRIEIAYALCQLERKRYFKDMAPFLINRLDNENNVIAERAFDRVNKILNEGNSSNEEAKIVLTTLKRAFKLTEREKIENLDLINKKNKLIAWANNVLN